MDKNKIFTFTLTITLNEKGFSITSDVPGGQEGAIRMLSLVLDTIKRGEGHIFESAPPGTAPSSDTIN